MTKLEKTALMTLAENIKKFASLENAKFSNDEKEDAEIKEKIKLYMTWFEGISNDIEKVVNISDESGYTKRYQLEEIIRLNL